MEYFRDTRAEKQMSLFVSPKEKGSREWDAFRAMRGDRIGAYRVALPHHPLVVRGAHHVLRIVYPQSPRELRLRGAH